MATKDFQGYTVYPDGRIKSNGKRKIFLKGYDVGKGYSTVKINGKNYFRHKIVALCFIGENDNLVINHKDGNKLNNHYKNLEYISPKENYQHALDNGLKPNIGQHLSLNEASDMIEFYNNTNYTQQEIASWFGFTRAIFRTLLKGNYSYKFKCELNG